MKHLIIIAILLFAATVYSDEHVMECLHSKDACVSSCSGSTKCIKSCLSAYESCIRGGSKEQQPQVNECDYDDFLAGRYTGAANKREIEMKCGKPHHIPGVDSFSSIPQYHPKIPHTVTFFEKVSSL